MNKKAKRVSKFFVALFVFLLALALVLGSTGAYYRATRKATGTIQLQKGIVVNYTGFSGEDQEWTSANATSFELFDERSAVPGEEIELVGTSIKADPTSVNFYARAKIEYEFDGTNDGQPVSNIQNINGLPFTASDLITADVFASNWKESGNGDGWNYYVSGDTYGTFVAGGAYKNVFKTGAKLIIEGTNFNGGDNGEGGGYAIADTDYVITTIRASLVLEFIQANAGAVSDFGWNYTSQGEPIEDPAPATFTDNAGITYTLNNEGTGYIVTGGVINANGQGGSVSGYSAKIGNSSVSAYDRTYSYTIISYIHGLPVTEIAPNAFAGSSDVYIVIPTTIVLIGEGAINIDATVTFETGRLNSISIKVNAIPTGTPLPNGEVFDGTEADDVEELYTLTLIDEKDNYDSFWAGYIAEAGYTYQGNGTYTIRLPYGTVGQLPAPTFDGYTFQYWYDEEDEIQLPANQDLTIEGDVTATAVYTENQVQPETYEVTLYFGDSGSNITFTVDDDSWTSHDGGAYYTKIYSAGEIVLLPTATADDNTYAFSYWEGKSSYSEEIYEDREYYAQYTINYPDYTVTLYIEDGSWDNVDGDALGPWNYNYDSDTYSWTYSGGYDNIVLPSVDAGYYWYCDGMTYGSGEEFEAYAQDYSIYLKYEEQQTYTVELRFEELKYIDSFDASAFEDWTADYEDSTLIGYHKTVAENTEITLPDDGKTEGYAWTYNDGKDAFNPGVTYNVKENITFNYKSYNINPTYRVAVYMEAGISKMFDSWDGWSQSDSYDGLYGFYKTVNSGASVQLPYSSALDGYWSRDKGGDQAYALGETISSVTRDIRLFYAGGQSQTYTVTLDGYWNDYANPSSTYYLEYNEDFDEFADEYGWTKYDDGEIFPSYSKTFTSGDSFTLPTFTNNYFWAYDLNGNTTYVAGGTSYTVTSNITFYIADPYTVALYVDFTEEEYVESMTSLGNFNYLGYVDGWFCYQYTDIPYGLSVTLPSNSNNGHWSYEPGGYRAFGLGEEITVTGDISLYYVFNEYEGYYDISIFDDHGTVDFYQTWIDNYGYNSFSNNGTYLNWAWAPVGTTIVLPTPSADGYIFLYWYADGGIEYSGGDTFTLEYTDVSIYAVWESDSTTHVTNETELRNALNDSSVTRIVIDNDITISSTIRATITDRDVSIYPNDYYNCTITATQSGSLLDYAFIFQSGHHDGSVWFAGLTLRVEDGFRSGIMLKDGGDNEGEVCLTMEECNITIAHTYRPERNGSYKNCVAVENNGGTVRFDRGGTITIDEYCWAAIDLDNSNSNVSLIFWTGGGSQDFVAENKGDMYEALVKVNDSGKYNLTVEGCAGNGLFANEYGYDYMYVPEGTHVTNETELRNALNDSSVTTIILDNSINIYSTIRAAISDRDVAIYSGGHSTYWITAYDSKGTLKDFAFVFTSDSTGSVTFNNVRLEVSDGFRSGIMIKKDSGNITLTLQNSQIWLNHNYRPQKNGSYKNCVAIQNNDSTLTLKGNCTITIDEYCWAAIDLDNSNDDVTLTFYDGANITFVANNKGSMYEALVKVNDYKNGMTVSGYSAQNLVSTQYGYDYDSSSSSTEYTVTLAFSDTSLVDTNFDSSAFKGWEATYKASPTGFTRTVEAGTKITLPDDGKYTGYVWSANDGKEVVQPGDSYTINNNITFTYQPEGSSGTEYTVTLRFADTKYMGQFDGKAFDDWTEDYNDNDNLIGYHMTVTSGTKITLPKDNYDGYVWSDGKNSYDPGESYTVKSSVTFTYQGGNSSSTEYTVTLAFSDTSLVDTNFDSSAFKGWEATYKASPTGFTRTVEAGTEITLPDDGKYTGYVWSADGGKIIVQPGDSVTIERDITYTYTYYSDESYTVNFYDDIGYAGEYDYYDSHEGGTLHTTETSGSFMLPSPTAEGYVFRYWNVDGYHYAGGEVVEITENVSFSAVWREENEDAPSYTVTLRIADDYYENIQWEDFGFAYSSHGESYIVTKTVEEGESIQLPTSDTYVGSWGSYDLGEHVTIVEDKTFIFSYDGLLADQYFSIMLSDTTSYSSNTFNYLIMMEGWTSAMGSVIISKSVQYGTEITLPSPEKEGWTFLGWAEMTGMTVYGEPIPGGDTYTVTSAVTLFARWQNDNGNTVTIKNVDNSLSTWMMMYSNVDGWTYGYDMMGMSMGPKLYKTAKGAITLPTPQPFQYNGQTYYLNYFSTSQYDMMMMGTHYSAGQEITPTGDTTLYAYFTAANTISLYNSLDGGEGYEWNFTEEFTKIDSHTYAYSASAGTSVTLPAPTLNGYTFAYWQDQDGNRYAAGASYTISGDATLTAVWVQGTAYTVTIEMTGEDNDYNYYYNKINWAAAGFYKADEEGIYQLIVSDGAVVTLPTSGWYTGAWVNADDNLDTQNLGAQITVEADVDYIFEYEGDITRYQLTIDFQSDYDNYGDRYDWDSPNNYFDITGLGNWSGNYVYYEDGEGTVLTLPTAITYEGRIISGYFIASDSYDDYDGTRYELGGTITLNGDITLYFHSDGYTEYYEISLYFNGNYSMVGYIDDSWTIEYEGGDPYRAYKYVENGTTITFPDVDNEGAAWGNYEPGSEYDVYYSESFWLQIKSFYNAKLVLGNYAAHVVSLDGWTDAGNGTYTKRVKEGVSFNLPEFDAAGYYWRVGSDNYYNGGNSVELWENRTYTLVYVQTFTATLHLNGESFTSGWLEDNGSNFTDNGDGTYSRSFTVVDGWSLPSDSYYFSLSEETVFYGWYSDQELTQNVNNWDWYRDATGNVDFYAKYGPRNVTLKFNLNGGTTDWWYLTNYMSYDDGEGVYVWSVNYNNNFDLPTLTKDGHTFVGFFDNPSFTGQNWNEERQEPNSYYTTRYIYPRDFESGTTFYAQFLENYVENNMIFAWDVASEAWTLIGVTDDFNLETLTIPAVVTGNGHTGNVTKIGSYAFAAYEDRGDSKHYSFNTIIIPNTVVEIGSYAFYANRELSTVTFAENSSLRVIGMSAFDESDITSITIPASVEEIGYKAFDSCYYLEGITVDGNNQVYSSYYGVVYNKAQTQIKIMVDGLTGIDGTVKIPATVTTIDGVLRGSFTHLVFEGDITIVRNEVQYRGEDSRWLEGINTLRTITFTNADPSTLGDVDESGFYHDLLIFVPAGSVEAYQAFFDANINDYTWTALAVGTDVSPTNTALDGVEYDDENGVYTYTDARGFIYTLNQDGKTYTLTDAHKADLSVESDKREDPYLKIESAGPFGLYRVTAIGEEAFREIETETRIYFKGITSVGAYAFYGCTNIRFANDWDVTYIGEYAFYGCSNIQEIYIKAIGDLTIGAHAFDGAGIEDWEGIVICSDVNNATITIGEYAFANITSMNRESNRYFEIADSSKLTVIIGAHAFDGLSAVNELRLGNDSGQANNIIFEEDSLVGANFTQIVCYNTAVVSGLEVSGVSSSTTIYFNSDADVETYSQLLPNNTVENYNRVGRPDYTDSYGVVYRYMPLNNKNWGYVLYSTPNDLSGSYTILAEVETENEWGSYNRYTVYGIWQGVFANSEVTDIYFSAEKNAEIWSSFANLPTANTNTAAITYHLLASVYATLSENQDYAAYTLAEEAEPNKLLIWTSDTYYFGGMSDYTYYYDSSNKDTYYYKNFTQNTESFSLPYSNGNYGDSYTLTFYVEVYDVDDGWTSVGTFEGGETFYPSNYSSDVRLTPNWEYHSNDDGYSYVTVYVPNEFSLKGWTTEYNEYGEDYIMTYEYYYDGDSRTVYLPTEKDGMSNGGLTFDGWYLVEDWDDDNSCPFSYASRYTSVTITGKDEYYDFYGYWYEK